MNLLLLCAVVGLPSCPETGTADEAKEELAKLQGTWQLISAETDGTKAPDERVKKIQVIISGNRHSVRFGDQVIAHDVSFEIDTSTSPKAVTDTLNEGPDKGKQIRGIYKLEGDVLTSCVAAVDKDRPVEFSAKQGSGHTLRMFHRVVTGQDTPAPKPNTSSPK
jgi:uncharacterized protein (TIGR03067 family)